MPSNKALIVPKLEIKRDLIRNLCRKSFSKDSINYTASSLRLVISCRSAYYFHINCMHVYLKQKKNRKELKWWRINKDWMNEWLQSSFIRDIVKEIILILLINLNDVINKRGKFIIDSNQRNPTQICNQ